MRLSAASRASLKAKILLGVEEAPKDDEELSLELGRLALRPPWRCEMLYTQHDALDDDFVQRMQGCPPEHLTRDRLQLSQE